MLHANAFSIDNDKCIKKFRLIEKSYFVLQECNILLKDVNITIFMLSILRIW